LIILTFAISLFQLVRIEFELSELSGVKVVLISVGANKNQKLPNYTETVPKMMLQA
jgi:hypothetical protein